MEEVVNFNWLASLLLVTFSALTLLVGQQKEHAACVIHVPVIITGSL